LLNLFRIAIWLKCFFLFESAKWRWCRFGRLFLTNCGGVEICFVFLRTRMRGPMKKHEDSEERALVLAAFSGDERAFSALVKRYQGPVYNLCFRSVGSEGAQDMAQEVFLRAFVNRHRFEADRPVLPWLLTIARHLCIDWLRARQSHRFEGLSGNECAGAVADPEVQTGTRQALDAVSRSLRRLPEGQREALLMFHVDGLPCDEVARILDVPRGTVLTWLHRARAALRSALSPGPAAGIPVRRAAATEEGRTDNG
jgi:RNA polymerase sigma-70 factor (ECF subfamily)